jgi:hypothetical protein
MHVEQLPVKKIDDAASADLEKRIVNYVDEICQLNANLQKARSPQEQANVQRRIVSTDFQLNTLIYRLFGLSEDDIRTIERSEPDVMPLESVPAAS